MIDVIRVCFLGVQIIASSCSTTAPGYGAMLPCHDDAILSTIRSHLLEWAGLEKHREARGSGNGDINKRLVLFLGIILATILDNYRIF